MTNSKVTEIEIKDLKIGEYCALYSPDEEIFFLVKILEISPSYYQLENINTERPLMRVIYKKLDSECTYYYHTNTLLGYKFKSNLIRLLYE